MPSPNSKPWDNFGEQPALYSLLVNPYRDTKLSKCPLCKRPTHPRKFPLVIVIEGWGPLVLGKTCRYCSPCELIVLHQDELEHELAVSMERIEPEVIGNKYFVLGTMEKKVWQQGMQGILEISDPCKYTADFKKYYDFKLEGGGWGMA